MYWLSVHIASVHSENLSDYCFVISRTKDGSGNALECHMIVKDFFFLKKMFFVLFSFPVTQASEELGGMS